MKPCVKNQEAVTLLATGGLEAAQAAPLREHLAACPGCREYFAEMSGLAGGLAAVKPAADLRTSETFHQAWLARVKRELPARSSVGSREYREEPWNEMIIPFKALVAAISIPWRVAFSAGIVLLVSLRIWIQHGAAPVVSTSLVPSRAVSIAAPASASLDQSPTLAIYQQAASQSLDKLDDVLLHQASAASSSPVCTAAATSINF